jgi:tetratricopeptide (TPR) repeat protein
MRFASSAGIYTLLGAVIGLLPLGLLSTPGPLASAQSPSIAQLGGATIDGVVTNSAGIPQAEALVRLSREGAPKTAETTTSKDGSFSFSDLKPDHYTLKAEKSGVSSRTASILASSPADHLHVQLILEDSGNNKSSDSLSTTSQSMEFSDKPSFTVAGVVDWTAVGGHGSDSSLRTSESLVRETITLKKEDGGNSAVTPSANGDVADQTERALRAKLAAAPDSSDANDALGRFYLSTGKSEQAVPLLRASCTIDPASHECEYILALALQGAGEPSEARKHLQKAIARSETADSLRLAGELDEQLGDPLAAVREFEHAARMDPSEQNYFEYGSELLKHRAVWQAQEVFQKGVDKYPTSARMLLALGTAFFSGARYDDAAHRFCEASDLNPASTEPYLLMGQIELEAPNPLACAEQRLARFVAQQPGSALANYYYAMALWKDQQHQEGQRLSQQIEALLMTAVTIDPECSDAYLQLGNLSSSRRNYAQAIEFYQKAISTNPELAEAHYRLGVAYDRTGKTVKAKQEFESHDEIKKKQAAAIEQQRREVKQFLVVLPDQASSPATPSKQ